MSQGLQRSREAESIGRCRKTRVGKVREVGRGGRCKGQ